MNIATVNPRSAGLDFCLHVLRSGHKLTIVQIGQAIGTPWQALEQRFECTKVASQELSRQGIHAVMPGCEEAVSYADDIAAGLALPHNKLDLRGARASKSLMFDRLKESDIPLARTWRISNLSECPQEVAVDRPMIVKPSNSSASEGVRRVTRHSEMEQALSAILGKQNRLGRENSEVLVQEFLSGPMLVVNTVSKNGVHLATDIHHKDIVYWGDKPISASMTLCTHLNAELQEAVRYVFDCLDALGFCFGAAHTEVILTKDGPRLVEVNSRLMGPELPADVYVPVLGYSQASVALEAIVDEAKFVGRLSNDYGCRDTLGHCQLRPHRNGTLKGMPGLDDIRRLPGFLCFKMLPEVETQVLDRYLTSGVAGIAYFRHAEENKVSDSIRYAQELAEAGNLFEVG